MQEKTMKRRILPTSALIAALLIQAATASPALETIPPPAPAANDLASVPPGMAQSSTPDIGENGDYADENIALLFLCMTALADGKLSEAQKACGQSIALNPDNPAPYKLRGTVYLFESQYEQARADFAEAVRLDPTDPESHAGYSVALRSEGKYRNSIAQISIAIQLAPNDPRMWTARCWTRGIFARELRNGLSDCNEALRFVPGDADTLGARGFIYLRTGRLTLAVSDFDVAIRKHPDLILAFYGRGIARLKRGNWKGAATDISRARAADPKVDEIFAWSPLIPAHCPKGVDRGRSPRCVPQKAPAQSSSLSGKTAQAALISMPSVVRTLATLQIQ
jgi:tetratricopeptide (TPR) repeat protein